MNWEAHPDVLDREKTKTENSELINLISSLLTDIIDYGTNAYLRCKVLGASSYGKHAALTMYFHLLEMLDAASVLFREGICLPVSVQLRSAFEALLGLIYLTKEDTERRAQAYIFINLLTHYEDYELFHAPGEKGLTFRKSMDELGIKLRTDEFTHPVGQLLLKKIMSDDFSEAREYYDALPKRKRDSYLKPAWYSFFNGPKNLHDLAKECGRLPIYKIISPEWSRAVHITSMYRLISAETGEPADRQLRDSYDLSTYGYFASIFGIDGAGILLSFLRPGEENAFARWVKDNLRERYLTLQNYRDDSQQ